MTNVLRLDAGAIAALFPEGSEMKLELQNAVIAEFAKKNFYSRASIPDGVEAMVTKLASDQKGIIDGKLKTAIDAVIESALRGAGYLASVNSWRSEVKLLPDFEKQVKALTTQAVSNSIENIINTRVAEEMALIVKSGKWEGVIRHNVEVAVNKSIVEKITAALAGVKT